MRPPRIIIRRHHLPIIRQRCALYSVQRHAKRVLRPRMAGEYHIYHAALLRTDTAALARDLRTQDAIARTDARGALQIRRGAQYVHAIHTRDDAPTWRAKLARLHDASTKPERAAKRDHLELFPAEKTALFAAVSAERKTDKILARDHDAMRETRAMRRKLALEHAVSEWSHADRSTYASALAAISGEQSTARELACALLVDGFYPDDAPAPAHVDGRLWRDARRKMRRAPELVQRFARLLARKR